MQAVNAEGEADGRQSASEASEEVVVAASAADRRAQRGVVDLEYGAGVVADVAQQSEVEDHALCDGWLEQLVHEPHAGHRLHGWRRGLGEQLWAAAPLRDLEQQLRCLLGEPARVEAPLQLHEVAPDERAQELGAHGLAHLEDAHERGVQRGIAETDAVVVQPHGIERVAEHGQHLGGPLRSGRADQLDPGLQQLARLPALWAHAAVAMGEVAEAQRRLTRRVACGHHARDRSGHVRAQREHGSRLVEDAIRGAGFRHIGALQDGLVLERRRVDLAVPVALDDTTQRVGDRAHLARLFG